MAENRIQVLLDLQDRFTDRLKGVERNVKSFSSRVQTDFVSIAAKVFIVQQAFRAVSGATASFISAATKQEDAIKRLNNALEIQGIFTDELSLKYQRLSENIQKSTRFGDDDILESMQQLISIGGVAEDQMERATNAAIDFATATGRDLSSATLLVAKAMQGATGELSRYGIILDKNTTGVNKSELALRALESRFGGSARKDISTYSGQVQQLSNSWNDFQEVIGEFITKSNGTKGALGALNTAVQFWTEKLKSSSSEVQKQDALMDDLIKRLDAVNVALENNMKAQSAPFLLNRNEVEAAYNRMLEERSRILLTINDIQKKPRVQQQQEEQTESTDDRFAREMDEATNHFSFMESLYDEQTNKIKEFNEKIFKDDSEKAKAKKKLNQDILNNSVSNLQAFAEAQSETSRAAGYVFKGVQLARAVINTAEGITEAIPNIPLMAFAAAAGAAQIATIASTGFARGTDSVPSMLTPGEMVVPRDFAQAVRSGDITIGGREGGSGFGDINIFIQGGIRSDGASVEDMAEKLGFEFERRLRTARGI